MKEKPATITAFDIIHDNQIEHFVLRMNDHIRQGWQPYGEFKLWPESTFPFVQAVVRYDTQPIS